MTYTSLAPSCSYALSSSSRPLLIGAFLKVENHDDFWFWAFVETLKHDHLWLVCFPTGVRGQALWPCRRPSRCPRGWTCWRGRWRMLPVNWRPWPTPSKPLPRRSMPLRSVHQQCNQVWKKPVTCNLLTYTPFCSSQTPLHTGRT